MMAAGAVLGASRLPTLALLLAAGDNCASRGWWLQLESCSRRDQDSRLPQALYHQPGAAPSLPPLHHQQQRRQQGSLGACPGWSLSPSLLAATVEVVRSAVPSRLHVVVQGRPDSCLMESLWAAGVGVQVADAETWWAGLADLTYLAGSQHLLVGQLTWLIHTMLQVRPLYRTGKLNAVKTRWIWVATDVGETPASPPSSTRPPPVITFSEALERFSDGTVEGMRGVLVAMASRKRSMGPLSALQHDVRQPKSTPKWVVVVVGGVEAPGDGRWYLRLAATYTTRGGLDVSRDLWPPPSSNLGLRTVRIACIKKPMVFEFQDGVGAGGLDEAGGYIVELMRVVRQRLNFTDVLVATHGFGLLTANGSWNGMVGVLQRREADMAALDFTPSWRRTQVVEFSRAIGQDEVVIISRAPAAVVKPFLLMQIFSPLMDEDIPTDESVNLSPIPETEDVPTVVPTTEIEEVVPTAESEDGIRVDTPATTLPAEPNYHSSHDPNDGHTARYNQLLEEYGALSVKYENLAGSYYALFQKNSNLKTRYRLLQEEHEKFDEVAAEGVNAEEPEEEEEFLPSELDPAVAAYVMRRVEENILQKLELLRPLL